MAIVVGTDTYISVADADSYWANRNNTVWAAAVTAAKEAALREATQYLDGKYTFIGQITSVDQLLAWPRFGATITAGNKKGVTYDSTEYPPQLTNSCAELALEALSARLAPAEERGGAIKRERVDIIEVEYMDFAPSGKTYNFVLMLIKEITTGLGSHKKLVRC